MYVLRTDPVELGDQGKTVSSALCSSCVELWPTRVSVSHIHFSMSIGVLSLFKSC